MTAESRQSRRCSKCGLGYCVRALLDRGLLCPTCAEAGNNVDSRTETVFTEDMTNESINSTHVEVFAKEGTIDFDNNEEASEEFVSTVADVIEGAMHAAWANLSEKFPEAGLTIKINGFVFGR